MASYKEVFQKYFYELTASLPMKDSLFIANLATHKLLPGDTRGQIEARATPADKASYFLDYIIKPSLDVEDVTYFNSLMKVMEESEYNHVRKLAHHIKCEVNGDYRDKSQTGTYTYFDLLAKFI